MSQWSKAYQALLQLTYNKKVNNAQPSKQHPRSTATMVDKRDIPRIVPNYNPEAIYDLTKAAKLRALLSAFHTKLSKGARHLITSDDEQLVLDSGCSIAITPDLTDFVDGTYSIQNYNVNGIGSGLQAIGI